ncbi:MAG: PilZ domain-containing protein [Thermoanaerobaculia bacterium]|nr:PilZ domain-containing protein [Thermoanaerobaculia bacterium]
MSEQDERRPSVRVRRRIECEWRHGPLDVDATIEDISESGAFIDSPQIVPAGTEIEMRFPVPEGDGEVEIEVAAEVIWTDATGMGVHFLGLSQEDRTRIRFLVAATYFDVPVRLPAPGEE